jgi:rhodanese-related sulfurtransferase
MVHGRLGIPLALILIAAVAQTALAGEVLDAKTADAKAKAGEIVLVDIRTPEEWLQTGVPATAHAITMHQSAPAFLAQVDKALGGDKSKPLALICRTGNRSGSIAPQLEKLGYKIIDVSEGMAGSRAGAGWLKSGLALRTGNDVSKAPAFKLSQ